MRRDREAEEEEESSATETRIGRYILGSGEWASERRNAKTVLSYGDSPNQ